jgi:hypothetical protein
VRFVPEAEEPVLRLWIVLEEAPKMSKERANDDPRQQTDWKNTKQTDQPWKGPTEKEQQRTSEHVRPKAVFVGGHPQDVQPEQVGETLDAGKIQKVVLVCLVARAVAAAVKCVHNVGHSECPGLSDMPPTSMLLNETNHP